MTETTPSRADFTIHSSSWRVFHTTILSWQHWASECLMTDRVKGFFSIKNPAAGWAAYVLYPHALGVETEAISAQHGGPFAGTTTWYVLRSHVRSTPMAEEV